MSMHTSCLFHRSSSFFFNATPSTRIYTLSLHDALPISIAVSAADAGGAGRGDRHRERFRNRVPLDRKSTRLNSSHRCISYAVFCLKKKRIGDDKTYVQPIAEAVRIHTRDRGTAAT